MSCKNKSVSSRPVACQYPIGNNQKCGETQTLEIIKEFRQLYENKMKQIDAEGGGDCVSGLQVKYTFFSVQIFSGCAHVILLAFKK